MSQSALMSQFHPLNGPLGINAFWLFVVCGIDDSDNFVNFVSDSYQDKNYKYLHQKVQFISLNPTPGGT